MIKRILRQLRKQSKASRNNVAFVTASVLTGMVALVWMYHAPARLGIQDSGVLSNAKEEPGFWQLFSDFGSQMATVKDSLPELQDSLTNDADITSETSFGTDDNQYYFDNSAGGFEENTTGTSTDNNGFLKAEQARPAASSQPIRIITVSSTTTTSATTSESW